MFCRARVIPLEGSNMTLSIRQNLTVGMAILGAGAIVAVSPPSAMAEGGLGGTGGGTITGPGGTSIGTTGVSIDGKEDIPHGTPGALGCLTGGCSGSLTAVPSIVTGPSATPIGSPGLQTNLTVIPPQPNAIACITAICHGSGMLTASGGVKTPIVGATGGLSGLLHG